MVSLVGQRTLFIVSVTCHLIIHSQYTFFCLNQARLCMRPSLVSHDPLLKSSLDSIACMGHGVIHIMFAHAMMPYRVKNYLLK